MLSLQQVSERVTYLESNYTQLPHVQVKQECREVKAALRALSDTDPNASRSLHGRVQRIVVESRMDNLSESEINFLGGRSPDDITRRPGLSTRSLLACAGSSLLGAAGAVIVSNMSMATPPPLNPSDGLTYNSIDPSIREVAGSRVIQEMPNTRANLSGIRPEGAIVLTDIERETSLSSCWGGGLTHPIDFHRHDPRHDRKPPDDFDNIC